MDIYGSIHYLMAYTSTMDIVQPNTSMLLLIRVLCRKICFIHYGLIKKISSGSAHLKVFANLTRILKSLPASILLFSPAYLTWVMFQLSMKIRRECCGWVIMMGASGVTTGRKSFLHP